MDCRIPVILAYAMAAYTLSSFLYLFTTNFTNTGTPIADEINKNPELKKLQAKSRKDRGIIFFFSICISAIFLSFVKPFHGCYNFNNNQEIFLSNTI